MTRLTPWTLSVLLILTAVLALTGLSAGRTAVVAAPQQATASPSPTATPPGCVATFTKTVWPDRIRIGDTTTVTLHARPVCPARDFALHVVLVLDGSASMVGSSTRAMKESARKFVQDLSLQPTQTIKVGVVNYNATARTLCQLDDDEATVLRAIDKASTVGEARMESGLVEGQKVLAQGRRGMDRNEMLEVMIVMSDSQNVDGCDAALREASRVKSQGILLVTVCIATGCDETCLRQVASSSHYALHRDDFTASFAGRLVYYLRYISIIPARFLSVDDTLAEGMDYVPDSAVPTPSVLVTPTRRLRWAWYSMPDAGLPREGITATFRVRPSRTGLLPTNLAATGVLTDGRGYVFTWTFPVPQVLVLDLPTATSATTPTPSSTPLPPTRVPTSGTPSVTPSATGSRTPTVPPTATATQRPPASTIHLPIGLPNTPFCPYPCWERAPD